VTAGYIRPEPRRELYARLDAANVDLKSFSDEFYRKVCGGELAPVLETLEYIHHETDCWLEITTLLIPGANDGSAEIEALTRWVADKLGPDVPLHFTAFHPDYKMTEVPPTPASTLRRARQIGLAQGLHHVYTGNVHDAEGGSTLCTGCGEVLIRRDWYRIEHYALDAHGACPTCGTVLAGHFGAAAEHFGRRRIPLRVAV